MLTNDLEELSGFDPQGLSRCELEATVERCGRVASFVAATKYAALAALAALADNGTTPADTNRVKTRESGQASKRAAATALHVVEMPGIQSALATGEISPEHAEAAAAAAARVSAPRADDALTRLARQLPADRFAKEARAWASRNEVDDAAATRQERARVEREGRVWRKNNGRIGIYGELDPVAGAPALARFDHEMDRLYRADGGREADPSTARTFAQRGADVLATLLAGSPTPAAGDGSSTRRPPRPHPRFVAHLRVDPGRCRSSDPSGVAEFLDGTPIPQSALERIACEGAFVGAVYGADGAVLWQGRSVRLATDDQWMALIDRDGGCRHCGADPSRCQAHHLDRWAPPINGSTNIDRLVLVCDHGHHLLHEKGWRVVIDDEGGYHIVPPGSPPATARGPAGRQSKASRSPTATGPGVTTSA